MYSSRAEDKTFYCHKGGHFISRVRPNFRCHLCDSPFIEEIDLSDRDAVNSILSINADEPPRETSESELQSETSDDWPRSPPPQHRRRPRSRSEEFHVTSSNHFSFIHGLTTSLDIINALNITELNEQFGLFPETFVINAGDILSRILAQIMGDGSAPMSQLDIAKLAKVKINEKHLADNLMCTICIEKFELNEVVRRLECDHHFHYNCISPWLSLHSNCPICRKEFATEL